MHQLQCCYSVSSSLISTCWTLPSAKRTCHFHCLSRTAHVCLQDHVLPALQDQHKAVLACTCSALRELVQQRVATLKLFAGQCCRVHDDQLAGKLPAVTALRLRPGNLHEAMFVLPIFFMQVSRVASCGGPFIYDMVVECKLPLRAFR
jgi:hypothetical protein